MHTRSSLSIMSNTVKFLAGVWKRGITENYSDLNMAILPSGMTEDKVHRQLCDRSTCQWNVFHPSYCKTQCIMVIMLMNWHSWSLEREKEELWSTWEGMKFQGWKGDKKKSSLYHYRYIHRQCERQKRPEKDRKRNWWRGQMGKGYFSPWSAGFALTCSRHRRKSQ